MKLIILLLFSICISSKNILKSKRILEVNPTVKDSNVSDRKLFLPFMGPSQTELDIQKLRQNLADIDLEIDENQSEIKRGLFFFEISVA